MYAFTESDFVLSAQYFYKTVNVLESFQNGCQVFKKEYFFALNNLLMTYGLTRQVQLYDKCLLTIKRAFGKNNKFEKDLFSTTLLYEIGFSTELGMYEKVISFEDTILKGITKFDLNVINRQLFYINLSVSFMAINDFTKAHKYAIQIITDTASKRIASNSNIYFYAHFVALITQFEKGEYDYLKYAIQSTQNHLKRVRPLNIFDKLIMRHLKDMSDHPESKKDLCSKLLMNKVFDDREAAFAHQFFDFRTWMKSVVCGNSMNEIRKKTEIENLATQQA